MSQASISKLSAAHRAGCAFGAAVTTAGLATALLGAFVQTAAPLWLEPSPDVLEQVSRCETMPPRQGREACLQRLAAVQLNLLLRGVQVAEQTSEPR